MQQEILFVACYNRDCLPVKEKNIVSYFSWGEYFCSAAKGSFLWKKLFSFDKEKEIIESLKTAVDANKNEIKQKNGKISELLSEKEVMTEQYNKVKRCAKNMDQEIKRLRLKAN